MPAIIELRDTRAFHAAAKIWGYVRDNANSLDGARHMAFVKAAIENATQKERETSDALRQENETLRWLFAKAIYNSAETVMKKRPAPVTSRNAPNKTNMKTVPAAIPSGAPNSPAPEKT